MAEIAPLTPLRFDLSRAPQTPGGLGSRVAPPYDVLSPADRAELAASDPYNIVHLDLPSGDGDAKYENAARVLAAWRAAGHLVRDNERALYRYDQTFRAPGSSRSVTRSVTRRGFFALVRLAPFSDRIILPHERTLAGPKEDRLKLSRATRTQLSPGFMLYRDPRGQLDAPLDSGDVVTEFNTPDGVHHVLAKVTSRDAMLAVLHHIATSSLLIADGHHRYETAVFLRDELDRETPSGPKAEHRWFLSFLVNGDDPNLMVFPTHRHVHALPAFALPDLLARAADTFSVERLGSGSGPDALLAALAPSKPTRFVVAAGAEAAVLTLRADVDLSRHPVLGERPTVVRGTDVTVLHGAVLEHILGITPEAQAAKTNLWYPQDASKALAELRAGKGQALFLMNPTPVEQVRNVAEAGDVMPQKSTFFYPKVPTGLLLHTLDPQRFVPIVL